MARHHPQQPQPAHGHGSLRDATLDRFGLRVPIAVVEERLQASLPGATKAYTQGIFRIVVVFSILAGPMLWGSLGLRWALLAVACLWLLVPIAALTAKGTVRKNLEHWRRFPWQQGVSFINERQGLVLLSGEGFATEKPQAAWAPVMIEGGGLRARGARPAHSHLDAGRRPDCQIPVPHQHPVAQGSGSGPR
jgi:hypothetical protein